MRSENYVDPNALADRLDGVSFSVALFLAEEQLSDGELPAKNFYGKAFSILLWGQHGFRFLSNIERSMRKLQQEQTTPLPPNYHFEFNRYALLKTLGICPAIGTTEDHFGPERYTGTRVANWTLLRIYCRLHSRKFIQRMVGRAEIAMAYLCFAHSSGLIEDQRGAYTMQYHAFCIALLGELLAGPLKSSTWVHKWFQRSIDSLAVLVLPGGQCNYIGRGSLQSFGYAAAILAFAHAYRIFGNSYYLEKACEVLSYLERFQRSDGSFPLVLSNVKEGDPSLFDLRNPSYAGWWSYNNYYDYLPFLGAVIGLARDILRLPHCSVSYAVKGNQESVKFGNSVSVVRKNKYTAVIALPNRRVFAASQPMPYLSLAGRYPLPCFGGEQHKPSLYSQYGLPLPVIETHHSGEIVMANARYVWTAEHAFCATTSGVKHERCFTFTDEKIIVRDCVSWASTVNVRRVRAPRILLLEGEGKPLQDRCLELTGMRIEFGGPVEHEKEILYGPQGKMRAWFLSNLTGEQLALGHAVCETVLSM